MSVVLERLQSVYGQDVEVDNTGAHWTVKIKKTCFKSARLVDQHRQVKLLLKDFFDSGEIHALRICII
ncbi:BolA/IbaG family iron-sulfur metabolism protein [Gammaproteobacteria bacterium]|nr:BolA/IbaG family iron-sulfur metabolism protein [Gammaproteobacteria bacterium]